MELANHVYRAICLSHLHLMQGARSIVLGNFLISNSSRSNNDWVDAWSSWYMHFVVSVLATFVFIDVIKACFFCLELIQFMSIHT